MKKIKQMKWIRSGTNWVGVLLWVGSGSGAFAQSVTELHWTNHEVITRKKNGHYQMESKPILIDGNLFQNSDFKIVMRTEDGALTLDQVKADRALGIKAANALYHLNRIKRFFIEQLHSNEVKNLEQVVIRFDITNLFDEQGHFANINKSPQFNNALSVPAGSGYPSEGIPAWKRESWFRPEQRIPVQEILKKQAGDPLDPTLKQARDVVYPYELQTLVNTAALDWTSGNPNGFSSFLNSALSQGVTIALLESGFQVMKVLNRALIPQHLYVDVAFVPEIITHEFTHVALSDYMVLGKSTPVIEGYADYFAADLDSEGQLYGKIKRYNTARVKNGKSKTLFDYSFEASEMAQSDFVFSLFWGLRKIWGVEQTRSVIFESRKYVRTEKTQIANGLTDALFKACQAVCANRVHDQAVLFHYLDKRGL